MHRNKKPSSLDHLVSERENRWRQFEAEPFGSLEVDHGLVFCRLLERRSPGFSPRRMRST
jgi:hypothetical protein